MIVLFDKVGWSPPYQAHTSAPHILPSMVSDCSDLWHQTHSENIVIWIPLVRGRSRIFRSKSSLNVDPNSDGYEEVVSQVFDIGALFTWIIRREEGSSFSANTIPQIMAMVHLSPI